MFGKIFSSMYDGSLGTRGPWEALVTFQQMIVLCDRKGIVDMTADVISRRTLIPLEIIQKGIECLLLPDPESRDPGHEGRRIEPLDPERSWGWRILNYEKYRSIRTAEDRREYNTTYQKERRERLRREAAELASKNYVCLYCSNPATRTRYGKNICNEARHLDMAKAGDPGP